MTLPSTMGPIGSPILAPAKQPEPAAPRAQHLLKRNAGTHPLEAKFQMECFASSTHNVPLPLKLAQRAVTLAYRSYIASVPDHPHRTGAGGLRAHPPAKDST